MITIEEARQRLAQAQEARSVAIERANKAWKQYERTDSAHADVETAKELRAVERAEEKARDEWVQAMRVLEIARGDVYTATDVLEFLIKQEEEQS